jgi:hypothetical protein
MRALSNFSAGSAVNKPDNLEGGSAAGTGEGLARRVSLGAEGVGRESMDSSRPTKDGHAGQGRWAIRIRCMVVIGVAALASFAEAARTLEWGCQGDEEK